MEATVDVMDVSFDDQYIAPWLWGRRGWPLSSAVSTSVVVSRMILLPALEFVRALLSIALSFVLPPHLCGGLVEVVLDITKGLLFVEIPLEGEDAVLDTIYGGLARAVGADTNTDVEDQDIVFRA